MQAPELLITAVRSVLRMKAREGKTTKRDATLAVLGKIDKAGGPTKFGIGAAAMRMALTHIVDIEVTRQLKLGLTDHEYKFVLPAETPMEIIAALGKVPRWIAISDGSEAIWVPALQATAVNWMENSALKEKKAQQTQIKANMSTDIARFLMMNNFSSLEEAITKGA
jgi:hypothetical protein